MSMALFSPSPFHLPTLSGKPHFSQKPSLFSKSGLCLISVTKVTDNGAGTVGSISNAIVEEKKLEEEKKGKAYPNGSTKKLEKKEGFLEFNGVASSSVEVVPKFEDPRWVGGTWDLNQFQKDGKTNWDGVIDAEVRRRKWLEDNPESSNIDDPVLFDTSIIPWWSWVKRFHLPEAELLNGRGAMIGFFMAYLVDSLTGVGLVDQMGNYFCKTLLFIAVVGVLFIRKIEDIETLKRLLEETTFYDKQWQATWQDETTRDSKEN